MTTRSRSTRAGDAGFTIVEVMMAMVVLVVGMLGVSLMLSQASQTTSDNKARGQALSLARELTEGARAQAYTNLEPTTVVGLEQANSALADSDPDAAGWQVERRGKTFNVAVGVCSVDDINDGSGTRDTGTFCASGGGSTSSATCQGGYGSGDSIAGNGVLTGAAVGDCGLDTDRDGRVDGLTGSCPASACPVSAKVDNNADDFKRLVILVRWKGGPGRTYVLQNTTISYPGLTAAPAVTGITSNPTLAEPAHEFTSGTSLTFTATTNKAAETVAWYVNGQPQDAAATTKLSATQWRFGWSLGAVGATSPGANQVLDGDYLIEAKGFDKFGQYGARFPYSVKLNRRQPYPVPAFQSIRVGSSVEMDWSKSLEGDIVGYQVQRVAGSTSTVCSPSTATSCRDDAPPASGSATYRIWAQDKSGATTRDGDVFAAAAIDLDNAVPAAPATLTATKASSGTAVTLTWPSATDPEDGKVAGYAIFRDGTALSDLYGYVTVAASAVPPYAWTDPNGVGHSYWIAAVDAKDAQSVKSPGTGVVP